MKVEIIEDGKKNVEKIDKEITLLGRGIMSRSGFIALPCSGENRISRVHCTIFKESNKWFICDGELGGKPSRHGVFFEGSKITSPVLLEPGKTFVLLNPPPVEILLRIPEDEHILEDTLTPALAETFKDGISPEQIQNLKSAVADLHGDIRKNSALDQQLRDDVSLFRAERGMLKEQLDEAIATFSRCSSITARRVERAEGQTALLTRVVSGLALGIAIALMSLSFPVENKTSSKYLEIALEIILGVAGGGGLAAAGRFHKSGDDDDENQLVAFDELSFPRSPTGDAGAGGFTEGGRLPLSDRTQPLRATRTDEPGHRDGSGI